MSDAVRLRGLTKDYGHHRALDSVDLAIEEGEVFGYLGPNGAGKTTTIRVLLGMLQPTAGRAEVFGLDAWRDSVRIHARTGYVPGDPGLYDRLTGRQVIEYFAGLRHRGDDLVRATSLADRFDLALDRKVRTLSRGNRQKLAIVQAFMSDPAVIVLDEPTTGLDPLMQQRFHDLVREATNRGATVLLSSHTLSEVQRMADRVGIIRTGRLVAVERLDDLRAKALHRVEVHLRGPVDLDAFTRLDGVRDLVLGAGVLRAGVPKRSLDAFVKALGHLQVIDIEITEADLEDLFLTYYAQEDGRAT